MKRCREMRRLLERAFLEGVDLEQEFRIEEHAAGCPECARLLARERELGRALQELPGAPIEQVDVAAAVRRVGRAIDTGAGTPSGAPRSPGGPPAALRRRWLPVAAAGLALLALPRLLDSGAERDPGSGPTGEIAALTEPVSSVPPGDDVAGPALEPASFEPTRRSFAALEASDLDRMRLDEARDEVRTRLAEMARSFEARSPRERVVQQVEAFEALLAPSLGSWPVLRIVEGMATDPDPILAGGALRYLGVRGDGASLRVIERGLRSEATAAVALEALCDRGERGLPGLVWAFWNTPYAERVLQHVRQLEFEPGGARAARRRDAEPWPLPWVRDVLGETPPAGPGEWAGDLLALLDGPALSGGEASLDLLFELVGDRRWRGAALEALAARSGRSTVESYLAASLERGAERRHPESVRLDVIEHLGWAGALAWLVETCSYGTRPERALEVLASLDGADGADIADIVGGMLAVRREFAPARFSSVWRDAVRRDGRRFVEHAWRTRAEGGRAEASAYLDLLIESGEPAAVPAILTLVANDVLADDDRERAILIAGELGRAEHRADLRAVFEELAHDEPDLAAACLWSARRLGGLGEEAEVQGWIEHGGEAKSRRVLDLLDESESPRGGAMPRFRLARELEPVLAIRDESARMARNTKYDTLRGTTP